MGRWLARLTEEPGRFGGAQGRHAGRTEFLESTLGGGAKSARSTLSSLLALAPGDVSEKRGEPESGPVVAVIGADLDAVAWSGRDIAAFQSRMARLIRWGWSGAEAEALAEKLTRRDREEDSRVSCAECRHYSPGRCSNHRCAGLDSAEMGRDLAALLQRCAGFQSEV